MDQQGCNVKIISVTLSADQVRQRWSLRGSSFATQLLKECRCTSYIVIFDSSLCQRTHEEQANSIANGNFSTMLVHVCALLSTSSSQDSSSVQLPYPSYLSSHSSSDSHKLSRLSSTESFFLKENIAG